MRWLLAMTAVVLAACGPLEEGGDPLAAFRRDEVLGGRVAMDEPSVFLLSIRYGGAGYICTSTLVSPRVLLTAAHCVEGNPTSVRATNVVSMDEARGTWINAERLHVHPDYDADKLVADFAMVVLEREPPVPVIPPNFDPLDNRIRGHAVRVVGYGITSTEADDSGLKRSGYTQVQTLDAETFDFGQWGKVMTGTCSGDSGGPTLDFIDGQRRVVGVHSYHSGVCGQNTDGRVDAFATILQGWIDRAESPLCSTDGRCAQGCTVPDLDCACVEDGQCGATCNAPSLDPDCQSTCAADGVCSTYACATADPDCQPLGATCGQAKHCAGRLCITSEQHQVPYCSLPCAGPSDCPSPFTCEAGRCQYAVLPTAAEGESCALDATYCGGPGMVCAGWERDPALKCARLCYDDGDCETLETCVESPQARGICVQKIIVPRLRNEPLPAAGCASVPVLHVISLLALVGSLRRKTHVAKTRS